MEAQNDKKIHFIRKFQHACDSVSYCTIPSQLTCFSTKILPNGEQRYFNQVRRSFRARIRGLDKGNHTVFSKKKKTRTENFSEPVDQNENSMIKRLVIVSRYTPENQFLPLLPPLKLLIAHGRLNT